MKSNVTLKTAHDLKESDEFKMAGIMYRIDKVRKSFNEIEIYFYLATDVPTHKNVYQMTVSEYVIFTTHNYKEN